MNRLNFGYIVTSLISGIVLFGLGYTVSQNTKPKVIYIPEVIITSAEVPKEQPLIIKPPVPIFEPKTDPRLENYGAIIDDPMNKPKSLPSKILANPIPSASTAVKPVLIPDPIVLEEIPDNPYKSK